MVYWGSVVEVRSLSVRSFISSVCSLVPYALSLLIIILCLANPPAAARAQMDNPDLSAEDVAKKAMKIASEMCIYTNDNFLIESLATEEEKSEDGKDTN